MLLPLSYKPEATCVSNVHMITYGSCAFFVYDKGWGYIVQVQAWQLCTYVST